MDGEGRKWRKEFGSFTGMAATEMSMVVINTLYKAASMKGLSYFVFFAYSYVIGALTLLPLPFIFPRREVVPPLTLSIFCKIILSAIIGISASVCGFKGIEYSSPTLASAICNLTPAFTFILAIIFRFEKLEMRSSTTQIKIIGTIISILGAMVVVLYQGPTLISPESSSSSPPFMLKTSQANWVIGGILLVLLSLFLSLWIILQGHIMKMYPDERTVTLLYFICKTVIAVPVCIVAESNSSDHWKLRPDIALVTIVLSGLFGSSFQTFIHTWVVHLKGPLYTSIFSPFSVAITATFGIIFLGDALFLGNIIGTIVVLLGFYAVMWAKSQEDEENKDCGSDSDSHHGKAPLLQCNSVQGATENIKHVNEC